MSNIDLSSSPPNTLNPFSQLISDFRGKNLPSDQIEADYNNTLNYPNNYFVAPESGTNVSILHLERTCFCLAEESRILLE